MVTLIVLIHMALFSMAMTQQPLGNNMDRWWFLVTPVQKSPMSLPAPWLQRSEHAVVKRDDYTYTPGVGAYKCNCQEATWHQARRTCEEEGGHLAIINSIAESNAVLAVLNLSSWSWTFIGFHSLFENGEYVTIHSQSLAKAGFSVWATTEPNGGLEKCGALHEEGGLADRPCTEERPFVCELPID